MSHSLQQTVFAFLTLVALLTQPISAQSRITLAGTITDSSGGVLAGATVGVFTGDRLMTTVTEADGRYRLDLPSEGSYRVTVRHEGFTTRSQDISVTASATYDFQLVIAPLDDAVVVTASGTPESRASVAESLTVFTAQDIQVSGASSLADVVRQVSGLHVEANGREGALTSLFARGGESDYNHVLVDGVRFNISGGQFDFSRVSAGDIDRVEIVRGAQSALYGSDAIGAVIQVFTKRGQPTDAPEVSGSFEGGSFGTVRGDVWLLGGTGQRVDYQLGVAYRGTDGAFSKDFIESDRFDQASANGGLGVAFRGQTTVRGGVRYSNARGRAVGQTAYGPADRGTRQDTEDLSWHLRFNHTPSAAVHHAATVTYFRWDHLSANLITDPTFNVHAVLDGEPGARFPNSPRLVRLLDETSFLGLVADPASLPTGHFLATTPFGVSDFPGSFKSAFRRPSLRYQMDLRWLNDQVFSVGYEYARESDPLQGFRVDDHAYFAQQRFAMADHWSVSLGGRTDHHSHYGTEFSPKLSAGGYPLPFRSGPLSSIKVFASIGKGIKNPVFAELFGSVFVDGNPDLQPERARTIDGGLEVTLDNQRWLGRVTYFDNSYTDQVAFLFSPGFGGDGLPDFLNIAGSAARGVELEASLQRPFAGFTARFSYALIDTEVVSTVSPSDQFQPGQPLLRRPKHSGTLQLIYTRDWGSVHAHVRAIGRRHDSSFIGLARVLDGHPVEITVNPGYTMVGLGGQLPVNDDLTVFARVENLTDTVYESVLGYPGLPRSVVLGGRVTFGR